MRPTTTLTPTLKKTQHSRNLKRDSSKPNAGNVTPSTGRGQIRKKGAPPVPQRFNIVEAPESRGGWVALENQVLADLVCRLKLYGPGVSWKHYCFFGPKDQLQPIRDFANLFTSVKGQLSSDLSLDAEKALAEICADLAKSGDLNLSSNNIVSGSAQLVSKLASGLEQLAQKGNSEVAFALFSRCSAHTQVAILATSEGRIFGQAIEGDVELRGSFAKMLTDAARLVVRRGDSQLLKKFLAVCPLFAREQVLKAIALPEPAAKLELLCMADSDLKDVLLGMLPWNPDLPNDQMGLLWLRLDKLPQRSLSSPNGSKPPKVGDLQSYARLQEGGWLTKTDSGTLHLDNVPTKWDIPVKDVFEVMVMESPDSVMRLALHLFSGFTGAVKRSAHTDWMAPHAIQAWCALQTYADQLDAKNDPMATLAKEVCGKFRQRLVTALAGLPPVESASVWAAWLRVLDGRELAACRKLQVAPDAQIDNELRQWVSDRLADAFKAGSGEAARAAMRRCGVLGTALVKASNFIKEMLSSVVNDQSSWTQDNGMVSAFLAMLEEADPQVFVNLAHANATAHSTATGEYLIVQIRPDGQRDVVPGPLAEKIRSLMGQWLLATYSSQPVPGAHALADQSQPVPDASDFHYQQAMVRTMLSDAPPPVAWIAELREGAAQMSFAPKRIASALASAPPGFSPSSEVNDAVADHVQMLVDRDDLPALVVLCKDFGSENGQVFLAEVLGRTVWNNWARENTEKAVKVFASFLNSGPISQSAMQQFTVSSQGILGQGQRQIVKLYSLWRSDSDSDLLFTPTGKKGRLEWVSEAKQLVQSNEQKRSSAETLLIVKILNHLAAQK